MKKFYILIFLVVVFLFASIAIGRIGGGDIVFTPKKGKSVTFRHDTHVKDIGFPCTKCHTSIFTTKAKDKPAKMKDMDKGISCGFCHNGKDAFATKDKNNCTNCHK